MTTRGHHGLLLTAAPASSSPVVLSITSYSDAAAGSTHNVQMPATVAAGDLLVMIIASRDGNAGNAGLTTPSGWTQRVARTTGLGTPNYTYVFTKTAAGTEGGTTVAITSASASTVLSAQTWRIQAGSWGGTPQAAADNDLGANTTPDPPSLTPGWTGYQTLWIAGFGSNGQASPTVWSLTDNQTNSNSAAVDTRRAIASSVVNTNTTFDPGAYTMGATTRWASFTLAIRGP